MAKRDCIIYDKETKECKGLNKTYCIFEEECAFYKSKKEYRADGFRLKEGEAKKK